MKTLNTLKKTFGILIFFYSLKLFLFGSRYHYFTKRRYIRIPRESVIPVYISIIFTVLCASFFLFRYISKSIKKKSDDFNNDIRIDNLLKNGAKVEIDLLDAITQIGQRKVSDDNDLQSAINVFFPLYWIKRNLMYQPQNLKTYLTLKYTVGNQDYYKEIILPHSTETVTTYFQLQKHTFLYYDKSFPENCMVDLGFID